MFRKSFARVCHHSRVTACLLAISVLSGCATQPEPTSLIEEETLLIQSGNHEKLVEYYKAQLSKSENRQTRMKLALAYLNSGDPESALFFVSPLNMGQEAHAEPLLIEAKSLYSLGQFRKAKTQALKAYELKPNNAEIENLLGMICAANSDLEEARQYFTSARTNLYDDIKIKNNLAVLNIVEGHYQKAVQLLLPIYLKGKADKQIEANLTLAMAKIGNVSYIKDMSKGELSDQEIFERYRALKDSNTIGEFKADDVKVNDAKVIDSKVSHTKTSEISHEG